MIRPFTCLCVLMAAGSGLYLYQTKHRSQMLDRDIVKTVTDTEQARQRITVLKAEYALLNQPERLQALADKFLNLKPTQPQQFVQLADLASRLPPPRTASGPAMDDDDAESAAPANPATQPPAASAPAASAIPTASAPARTADQHVASAVPEAPSTHAGPTQGAPTPAAPLQASATPRPAAKPATDKVAEKPATEKLATEKLASDKLTGEKTDPEKWDHPADRTADRPTTIAERPIADRAVEPPPLGDRVAQAPRRAPARETARPAVRSAPTPLGAPVYQTFAPMPSPRSAMASAQGYTPYAVPPVTSALGAYRTPLAPPVPVGGEAR